MSATDDGLPTRLGKPVGMTFEWGKYRGPGNVVFDPVEAKIVDGKARPRPASASPASIYCKPWSTTGRASLPGISVITAAGRMLR
jgi:hypothetical protein